MDLKLTLSDESVTKLAVAIATAMGTTTKVKPTEGLKGKSLVDEDSTSTQKTPKAATGVTKKQLLALLKKVASEVSKDTVTELLSAFEAKNLKTLDESYYDAVFATATEILETDDEEEEEEEDDDFLDGDDEDEDEDDFGDDEVPSADEIKTALQGIAKSKGKTVATAVLVEGGLKTVRGLKAADEDTLADVWTACQKHL